MFKFSNKKRNRPKEGGYSFIEGVFATFIVAVGMVMILKLVTSTLSVDVRYREQTEATLLAQEGVEVVRNIRDNNWSQGRATFEAPYFPAEDRTNCWVDMNSTQFGNQCSNGNGNKILKKNGSGELQYTSGSNSQFSRRIIVEYNGSNNTDSSNTKITSMVLWNGSDNFPSVANCKLSVDCVYVSVTLNKWGGTTD